MRSPILQLSSRQILSSTSKNGQQTAINSPQHQLFSSSNSRQAVLCIMFCILCRQQPSFIHNQIASNQNQQTKTPSKRAQKKRRRQKCRRNARDCDRRFRSLTAALAARQRHAKCGVQNAAFGCDRSLRAQQQRPPQRRLLIDNRREHARRTRVNKSGQRRWPQNGERR